MGVFVGRRLWISVVLGVAALCGAVPRPVAQPVDPSKELLLVEMIVQSVKSLPDQQVVRQKLHIWRWSGPEDFQFIKECLEKGNQQALKKKMIKREPLGRLEGKDICYATCTRLKDGSFEVLCMTPIRLGDEFTHEGELVFSAIHLKLDGQGQGQGAIYSFARFAVTENGLCKLQTCKDPSFRLIGAKAEVFTP